MNNDRTELEIFAVRWARSATFQEIGIAMEAARHVPGDEATTRLFARAAAWRQGADSEDHLAAVVAVMASESGRARLSAACDRIERAQRILKEREGEGWDGVDEGEDR